MSENRSAWLRCENSEERLSAQTREHKPCILFRANYKALRFQAHVGLFPTVVATKGDFV